MNLAPGMRLGHFEVTAPIGSGGMGDVYKARDTRLDRTVAIKVLQAGTAGDRLARERLEREARAISALNHPHICTLHDIGAEDGIDYLVMEYVEGETLAARLAKGALPIDRALTFGIQALSALERAHHAGIVHRDIKPGNVMLTRTGVKLLDFGLAKAAPPLVTSDGRPYSGSAELTQSGSIVGTVQYMAPEQLEGRAIDARTDIFAFGALFYEMVSGRKAFEGDSVASSIAAILERQPPRLSSVQPLAPASLDRVVATCLEKNPDDRWQTARDLSRELQWIADGSSLPAAGLTPVMPKRRLAGLAVAAAVAGAPLAATLMTLWRGTPADGNTASRDIRFSIPPEPGSEFSLILSSVVAPQFALSPDWSHLTFVASSNGRNALWLRPLNALHAQPLAGTEDAALPFWSPDSRSIGFFSQGKLKTLNLSGGAVLVRAEASRDPRGATWGPDGALLAALWSFGAVTTVSAQGSLAPTVPVNRNGGEANHRWPSMLEDGRHFTYVVRGSEPTTRGVMLAAFGDHNGVRLVDTAHSAAVANGHLLFVRGRTLMAQPIDVAHRKLSGEPVAILGDVGSFSTGYGAFSLARSGALAYAVTWPTVGELIWVGRDGRPAGPPIAPLADYVTIALSPDGHRIAASRVDVQTNTPDIWLLDPIRSAEERFTSHPMTDANAFWSPDGSRIVFRSNRNGANRIYARGVNDSRSEEPISQNIQQELMGNMVPSDYSADGKHLLMTNTGARTSFDVWWFTPPPAAQIKPIAQSEFDEYHAVLSPDSRWMAFVSNESGVPEVYVQAFPDGGQRWQVSSQGGSEPQWRRDGRELYFLGRDQTLFAVPVVLQPTFKPGLPEPLFRTRLPVSANPYRRQYAASPDGQRFLINKAPDTTPPGAIHVVLDWRALLPSREE